MKKLWDYLLCVACTMGMLAVVHQLLRWHENRYALAVRKEIYRRMV